MVGWVITQVRYHSSNSSGSSRISILSENEDPTLFKFAHVDT
jgi:hypothetical protein